MGLIKGQIDFFQMGLPRNKKIDVTLNFLNKGFFTSK